MQNTVHSLSDTLHDAAALAADKAAAASETVADAAARAAAYSATLLPESPMPHRDSPKRLSNAEPESAC